MGNNIRKEKNHHNIKELTGTNKKKRWRVRVYPKGGKLKFGGHFKDEVDAGKRVNQLCEELRIPLHNPAISAIPNQQFRHNDKKTIENALISTEILNTDNDDANEKKRKREKTLKDEAVEKQYFYTNLLE